MSCSCGTKLDYKACCGLYISGEKDAPTAEATMRARYTAFANGDIDYIKKTFNPDELDQFEEEEIKAWSSQSTWHGLEVVEVDKGQENDTTGMVEFVAQYELGGNIQSHHEVAKFEKRDGFWYFMDGQVINEPIRRAGQKIGRNDPCHCGSGKKYKKCHG